MNTIPNTLREAKVIIAMQAKRIKELEAAAEARAGLGIEPLTRYLTKWDDQRITVATSPWGENGRLETPFIMANISDYHGHVWFQGPQEPRETTIEGALLALSARVAVEEKE